MSFTTVIILVLVALLAGLVVSIVTFGVREKGAEPLKDVYFGIEDAEGMGVVYTKTGDMSVILEMKNPVQNYSADIDSYYDFVNHLSSLIVILGEGYAIHKQDVFVRKPFHQPAGLGVAADNFLSRAYFRHFEGREYTSSICYLTITQKSKAKGAVGYDKKQWKEFISKVKKVIVFLEDLNIACHALSEGEVQRYTQRFFAFNFHDEVFSTTDMKVKEDGISMGRKKLKVFSLIDTEDPGLPATVRPFMMKNINSTQFPVDFVGGLESIPGIDTVVYNQVIYIPNQRKEKVNVEKRTNMFISLKGDNNPVTKDLKQLQQNIQEGNLQLVYSHFNLVVGISAKESMEKVTSHIENLFYQRSVFISQRAYNQLELFLGSFPGNCFSLREKYDRFITTAPVALSLMYKESLPGNEETPVKFFVTDRQGVPLVIDPTGKEGKVKRTDNSNFFVLGPSGSGKSFFTNTLCRQLYHQDTDIVIVDTGDSYENLDDFFDGIYVSYSQEHPISMNPFKISEAEYNENFEEKQVFLKSLVLLIFKRDEKATVLEDNIIAQTIVEYYDAYFHPFTGFTEQERAELHETLLLEAQSNGTYAEFEENEQKSVISKVDISEDDAERIRKERRSQKLDTLAHDAAASEGERKAAERISGQLRNELMKVNSLMEVKFSQVIELQIDKIEAQRRKLTVKELNFNSYYEFAIQRIPQIMQRGKVEFPIHDFRQILSPFYRGGQLEHTLNNDMDTTLFDEHFIVFEIDKVKENPVLFPIIVLIIMDVFTQKMRLKSCRKFLVIEEAWKAIATPVMANYIQYLYKTARKHLAMVGLVTQELQDIIGSDTLKNTIINNSGVFMLLDQSKFKDKFDDIKAVLGLTDKDCKKIFTINRLDNKEGRSPFKEVFIKRGIDGDVYGIEEPRECYMTYTTEKMEKLALKHYRKTLKCSHQQAVEAFVRDWEKSGIVKSLDFARKVLQK